MQLFLLSIVSIETKSLFQLVGASRLFFDKVVFPISLFYTEKGIFPMNRLGCWC